MPPPLAMRFWLFRRASRKAGPGAASPGRSLGRTMSIESLEHMVRSRVRMFLRHSLLVAFLGTLLLVGAVAAGIYVWTEADRLRIAVGPRDIRFVQALSDELAKQHRDLHLQILPTAGATASAAAMSKNEADFAILPSNLDDSLNWPVVAVLRQNVIALIVPAPGAANKPKGGEAAASAKTAGDKNASGPKSKSKGKSAKSSKSAKSAKADAGDDTDDSSAKSDSDKLAKVPQLAGKRVGIVTGSEATDGLLELVLGHYGVSLEKVTVSKIDPANLGTAIKNNQVDALFVAGAATGEAIASTVAAATQNGVAPSFIEIDQADGIAKRHPPFDSVDIDAGTFGGNPPGPPDSLKSLSFAEYLVARKSFRDSAVATLAKTLYTARRSLAIAMPGEVKIEAPATDKDADIVLHPGALAYLSDSQQSFFDKYGDDIFYGMLIFPVFGSAIAAMAGYLVSGTRTRRLRLLQSVLDLVRKAHAAQTVDALDQLQIEADNLVIRIIHQSEHEEFDETARMSFSFALDQLRFAIAGRRAAILDRAGTGAAGAGTAGNPGATAAAA